MTNGRILVDLSITHHSESKLSRLFVILAQTLSLDPDEHIILLEVNCSSFRAFRRINHVRLSIAVNDLKATQVLFVLLVDNDLLDG